MRRPPQKAFSFLSLNSLHSLLAYSSSILFLFSYLPFFAPFLRGNNYVYHALSTINLLLHQEQKELKKTKGATAIADNDGLLMDNNSEEMTVLLWSATNINISETIETKNKQTNKQTNKTEVKRERARERESVCVCVTGRGRGVLKVS